VSCGTTNVLLLDVQGDVRALHSHLLESYQLKSQDSIFELDVVSFCKPECHRRYFNILGMHVMIVLRITNILCALAHTHTHTHTHTHILALVITGATPLQLEQYQ
jgi:hypothetical protein